MGFLDRLGEWDDKSVLYDARTGESAPFRKHVKVWIASKLFTVAVIVGLGALIGTLAAIYALLIACVMFLSVYLVWRRRRNKLLTGSPWTLPRSD